MISKLIQWVPDLVRATDEDIARFGPQAAQVRGLLNFIKGMGVRAQRAAGDAAMDDTTRSARYAAAHDAWRASGYDNARYAAANAADNIAANAAVNAVMTAARNASSTPAVEAVDAAAYATLGEGVSDLISPQTYRTLTDPLNVGRVYDLRVPEAGSDFMRLIQELRPATADDVERLADLSVDPRAQGIIELLQGLQGGMPLTAKINAARKLDRVSRQGRMMP